MTTFMPAFEQARAIPSPMPSDDAVMYAVLPATSFNGGGCATVGAGGMDSAERGDGAGDDCARVLRLAPTPARNAIAPALSAIPSRNCRRPRASIGAAPASRMDFFLDMVAPRLDGFHHAARRLRAASGAAPHNCIMGGEALDWPRGGGFRIPRNKKCKPVICSEG